MTDDDFVNIELPNISGSDLFWIEYHAVRRDLFGIIKKMLTDFPWASFSEDGLNLTELFIQIGEQLVESWNKIKNHYKAEPDKIRRLSGTFFESLFYLAALSQQIIYTEAQQLINMGMGDELPGEPPFVVVLPIFEVVPRLFWFREDTGQERRYAPQVRADFVIMTRYPDNTVVWSLIDVKRSKPNNKITWDNYASLLGGAVYEIAYPKDCVEYPFSLNDWERHIVCVNCGRWPIIDGVCQNCDTHYT
ncbi:MAG: hypothetical protein ACTSRQ_16285 [Candidatus Thorarchaeota archaeon]